MSLTVALLIATVVVLVAILAVRATTRFGLPSLLLYLALGVLLGTSGIGIDWGDADLAKELGTIALVIILAEGGLTTRWREVAPHLGLGLALSTIAVAVSVLVMAAFMVGVLGMHWQVAVVAGAIISSTDAAAVFSVLRRLGLPPKVTSALELESGLNDAPVILLVTFLSVPLADIQPWWEIALLIGYELIAGLGIGLVTGFAGAALMRRGALPSAGLYSLMAIAMLLLSYELSTLAHASGFLGVYVAGVVLGNANLPFKRAVIGFAEALAWLSQIGLFVMLGLLVFPEQIPQVVLPALLIGVVLLFLARPLSVAAASIGQRVNLREQVFFSWAGLRGAVPIVLATIPISNGLEGGWQILHMVFVLVVVFTLAQGTTLPAMARRLGLTGKAQTRDLEVEVAVLDEMAADLMTVAVPEGSRLSGVYIGDLRLPSVSAVSLVIRGDERFVPDAGTLIRTGDQLLVVTPSDQREATERRLRAVARSGRLAGWFGDDGTDLPPGRPREKPGRGH
ncbi:potassium/proton antiporter [Cumulibacter manganitolerans]|uniref:potassium/proton antiporter n=1 Tax=Cumulibacter manganitolerans TaxID=1884992 RepID=UPI001294A735|nr:potassium/proton antiporter [Cumulibacter manganitolerans]